jgi:hypothetical protein
MQGMLDGFNCTWRRALSGMMVAIYCALTIATASLLFTSKVNAIELTQQCKFLYEAFLNWNEYYKVFAYGPINKSLAGCDFNRGEAIAIAQCEKKWGSKCSVYARSPVNGKVAIVWDERTNSEQLTALPPRTPGERSEIHVLIDVAKNKLKTIVEQRDNQIEAENAARAFTSKAQIVYEVTEKYEDRIQSAEHEILVLDRKLADLNIATGTPQRLMGTRNVPNRRTRNEQVEYTRKLKLEQLHKSEAKRQRIVELELTNKKEAKERRRRVLVRKRKVADAHEREMAPIRRKNRRSFAVIIGNRNYSGRIPTVDFAHNDADAMRQFIINKLGYREGNVFDLRDAGVNAISAVLGNEKSHKGTLFNALRKGQSDVIVYYSGHGVPGLEDKRPYLLPVDGDPNSAEITGYSVDTMYANLTKLPARSVTVFLDACFSGESEKGMLVSSASGISVNPKMPSSKGQMTVITAAQGNQLASWDPKARHGLFTKHLLDALNGEADGKGYGNGDGEVSLSEIQNYLDDEMTYQARATWKRQQNAYVRGSGDTILSTVFRVP